jgi:Zn-dependent protease/CBS domain-containing protein
MFTARWNLFRLLGIPIRVDASWLVILALLTWTLGVQFRAELPDLTPGSAWLLGLATAVAFFVCILLHELGHAVVARRTGIPMDGITLFLFGGVAEMRGEPTSAGREFWMAIAGPIVSAVLAGIFAILGWSAVGADWNPAAILMLRWLAIINVTVLIFNMIPAFPLDGGRVLRSILWKATGSLQRSTRWAAGLGQGFAWFLIAMGVLQFFRGGPGDTISGIWMGLIGLFLNNAARSSYQQVVIRQALAGEPVRRFMNTNPITVPPWIDLQRWVEDYVYRYHRKTFPVAEDGRLEGVISTGVLANYPRETWHQHAVSEVMRSDLDALSIGPDTDAVEALTRMQATGSSRLLVTEGGRLAGIVSLKDLLRFLHLKLELEGPGAEREGPHQPPHWTTAPRNETRAQP